MSLKSAASTARSIALMWAARIASVEENSPRNCGKRHAGLFGDVGKADLLEWLVGEKREKSRDDLFAVVARSGGRLARTSLGRACVRVCGP